MQDNSPQPRHFAPGLWKCYSVRHIRCPTPQTAGPAELCCTVDNRNPQTGAHFTSPVRSALVTHSPAHQIQALVLVYRCLHQLAPAYLSDLIIPYTPARSLRSADSNLITTNIYRLERCGRRRFSVAGPFLWNKLPASVKSTNSLGAFKSALKTHLFREAFMTLL